MKKHLKKRYRERCKERAADGMVNDAKTGQWCEPRQTNPPVSSKSVECSMAGSRLKGGATKSGPVPHFEIYEKKIV